MLRRDKHYLWPIDDSSLVDALHIERFGHLLMRGVFSAEEVAALRTAIAEVYARIPGDLRGSVTTAIERETFRYEMFNRCAASQSAIAQPRILAAVEPLLGGDCHVINCTAWRNPPGRAELPEKLYWHTDGGPHVPRPADVEWPDAIPYPIFVIATHIYLEDVGMDDGPTTVVPTSHRSGQPAPFDLRFEPDLEYRGHRAVHHLARAGDVGFFVSDVWHRRSQPTEHGRGRFFLQTNYARRDIAQRVFTTAEVNHVRPEAAARAVTERERTLLGLHPAVFYDS